ncbi:MAG: DUF4279 domain-containing protein [Solibacillus sp.]
MDKTSLYAYILFTGNDDFPLDIVTDRLGVQPTKTWKLGDRVKPNHPVNNMLCSHTGWRFEIDTEESLNSDDVLCPILDVFQSKTDIINQLKVELTLDVQLELVVHIYDGNAPALVIDPEFSKFAADINAILDIDMYVYPFNELDE